MLLQTNSYIVPKERRAEHARLIRRFRQALARIGCDQFEVYEQVGANWSPGGANGRYVQIMKFRDRQHQQAVQAAERQDHGAQHIIAEFCELINFPYQQQHGYFATGFYTSVLPVGPRQAIGAAPVEEEPIPEETIAEAGEWHEAHQGEAETHDAVEAADEEAAGGHVAHAEHPAEEPVAEEQPIAELPQGDLHEAPELPEEITPEEASAEENEIESTSPHPALAHAMSDEEAEAALLAEETPAQMAAEAAVADAFLDTIAEEHPPVADMGGHVPASGTPALSTDEQVPFAEAPIAPAVVELPPEEELVTADIFVPHDANAEPAEEALDFGEVELPELSATESELLEMPAEATDQAPAAQDAAPELHEAGLEDVGLDFTDEEITLPVAEHQEATQGQPGEQGEPVAEPAVGELHAAELGELGLDFDDDLLTPEAPAEQGVDTLASAHPIAESESPVELNHADHQVEALAELPIESHETGLQPPDAGPASEASADLSAAHEADAGLELPADYAAEMAAEFAPGHGDEMPLEATIGEHSSSTPSELPFADEQLEPGLDFAHAEHEAPAGELPAGHTGEEAALDSTGELLSSQSPGEPAPHAAEASGEHAMHEGLEFHEPGHADHAEAADVHPSGQVSEAGLEFADAGNASRAADDLLPAEDAVLAEGEPAKHDTSGLFADEDLILGLEPRQEEAAVDLPSAEAQKEEHTPEEHTPEVHTPGEMGLEFDEPAKSSDAPRDSALADALHDAPLHGLDDADHAIHPEGEHAAPAEAAAPIPIDLPLLDEPLAHEGPAVSAAPDAAPAIAEPAEVLGEEFSLDEGLIFDEDEIPGQGDMGHGDTGPTAHSDAIAGHDDAHPSAHEQGEAEPLLDSGGLPEEDGFDSLLDDTNMLVHAPASDNGHAVPANHADRQGANANPAEAPEEKDPDLLEFEAFLRQLDEGSGKLSN